ncbi:MAG: DUF6438 domain-containing protein [Bacteroidia bacterium]
MKTINLNNSIKNSLTVSLISSVLFLASCSKEELSLPVANASQSAGEARTALAQATEATASSDLQKATSTIMIRIEHQAARSEAPDYAVTIKFDGTIKFEGRRNVAYIGNREWKLELSKFIAIKNLFAYTNFTSIEDNLPLLADVPMIYTTYCASPADFAKTLFDYDHDYPEGLISLREKAEILLDLNMYIISDARQHISVINSLK